MAVGGGNWKKRRRLGGVSNGRVTSPCEASLRKTRGEAVAGTGHRETRASGCWAIEGRPAIVQRSKCRIEAHKAAEALRRGEIWNFTGGSEEKLVVESGEVLGGDGACCGHRVGSGDRNFP